MNVLFFNHKIENCGVYQYGKRLIEILLKDKEINYVYKEIECYNEYYNTLKENPAIKAVIYNYHSSTMSWLNSTNIQKNVKNVGIPHESPDFLFDIILSIDPTICEIENRFSIPRPIYENIEQLIETPTENEEIDEFIKKYTDTDIPIFGSFGFGFDNKGFDRIVKIVNEQYDRAVIKFVIPIAHFDPEPNRIHRMRELCINTNKKQGIVLMICHMFFSTTDILKFLKSNTMNIFLYDKMDGRGISSAIDYALSVKKPLGISDSFMFRNIYSDEICLYKVSINQSMQSSLKYCEKFLNDYSNQNIINKINNILTNFK
jgi:hypothetical protein